MRFYRLLTSFLFIGALLFVQACDQADLPSVASEENVADEYLGEAGDIIPGQYIVVLKEEGQLAGKTTRQVLDDMTSSEGVSELHRYGTVLNGFNASLSDAAVERLRGDARVDYIEQDRVVSLPPFTIASPCKNDPNHPKCGGNSGGGDDEDPPETTPWGIIRTGGSVASYLTACVIDSGVDLDHRDLNVDVGMSESFLSGKQSNNPDDENGHGTHVAGTIAAIDNDVDVVGVAAGATVVSIRVLDRRGSGTVGGVVGGVNYSATPGLCDVANMSLGGGVSSTLDTAVRNAASAGVKFALAAGNEYDDANNHSPARVGGDSYGDMIFSVSAMNDSEVLASFSNDGSAVEFAAHGVGVLSLWKNGGMNTISGTSMASPHVAGVILLMGGKPLTGGFVTGDTDGMIDPIAVHNK